MVHQLLLYSQRKSTSLMQIQVMKTGSHKERMVRGRTPLTYRIGGRQTVQNFQQ
jgi:hypothetical protein